MNEKTKSTLAAPLFASPFSAAAQHSSLLSLAAASA